MSLESNIKQQALALGFDAAGITTAEPIEQKQVEFYQHWLADGRAAKMGYLHRNNDKRFAPAELLNGAKSVICLALNCRPAKNESAQNPNIRIARYAQYEDYHPFIKNRLFQLAEYIQQQTKAWSGSDTIKFKACVDSAPLAERALARRAGLGFIGRNHSLIHPQLGCQILLGELLTTLELRPDAPLENQSCSGCDKCIRACPTGALAPDGSFDARKCISYLTIEEPDDIPEQYHSKMTGYVFGCDECILACPYEMNAPARKNTHFHHHSEWQTLSPQQILDMAEDEFQKIFAGSGFLRPGLERLKRNARIIRRSNRSF
jgi:epoxyqueuosine reductase